jgi:uncharacterized protein
MDARKIVPVLFLFLFAAGLVYSQDAAKLKPEEIPNPVMSGTGYVTSLGGYLAPAEIDSLNALIVGIERDTTAEIAVVVVPSLEDDIFYTAQALFDDWKIGKTDKDNGLLIIAAIEDHAIRTHTGYGMEGIFTDAIISWMQRSIITPEFKEGRYGVGLIAYVENIGAMLRDPSALEEIRSGAKQGERQDFLDQWGVVFILCALAGLSMLVAGFILLALEIASVRKNMAKSYTSYGKIVSLEKKGIGKRGFAAPLALFPCAAPFLAVPLALSGAGGLFAFILVGIAIPAAGLVVAIAGAVKSRGFRNDVLRRWRSEPRPCPECGAAMEKLSETEDDRYLQPFQIAEERVQSEDYDVWLCTSCRNTTIEKFRAGKYSLYVACPKCGGLTARQGKREIASLPTYEREGEMRLHFACLACAHEYAISTVIPVLSRTSSSSGSFGSGGGSSGGSSFGGGRSGGGGATGHW